MRRPLVAVALATAAAATTLAAIPVSAHASAATAAHHRVHVVRMTGAQEVPGPGDRNGFGTFRYTISHWRLCYSITAHRVGRPTMAHIHLGKKGMKGPVAVTLRTPARGFASGCIRAVGHQNAGNAAFVLTRAELRGIARFPHAYYVNVHNKRYPDGAIRGQL